MTNDTQMYGMTKQAVQDLIDDSYTKMVGTSMVAMGMLSDIQEVLEHSSEKEPRQRTYKTAIKCSQEIHTREYER